MTAGDTASQFLVRTAIRWIAAAIVFGSVGSVARAEPADVFPSRPIHIVVPFPAGSGTDLVARIIAQQMTIDLKQPVVVDNRVGASTIVGTQLVARAAPDGYTLVMASNNHAINKAIFASLPFDPVKDFTPIGKIATLPFVLVVNPALPVKTVKDLVDLAKAQPGKLAYASTSNGTPPHIAGEVFKQMAGIDMTHVPFRGSADAMNALISDVVPVMFANSLSVTPLIRSGQLRPIAVGSPERLATFPDLPTVAESGYPGFDVNLWAGLLAPAKTPQAIVEKLNAEIVHALSLPAVRDQYAQQGALVTPSTPEEFGAFVASEVERLGKVARDAHMKAE
jgi:tripartite-type tricarboxylate transporter receptor subunit TctC